MSVLKLKGGARAALVALALLAASSLMARAEKVTLICHPKFGNVIYEDEPTTIVLNEAESTVVVNFSAAHLKNPDGITGGVDGHGGINSQASIGPLPAVFSNDTITFSNSNGRAYVGFGVINRLTGAFVFKYNDHDPVTVWQMWNCEAGKRQF
jgi:hypothetical protein